MNILCFFTFYVCILCIYGSTVAPTESPSEKPSVEPTIIPTIEPSDEPSIAPSIVPSINPTMTPSASPTTVHPSTIAPSQEPSVLPTTPSVVPTTAPSRPTVRPSFSPTFAPTKLPSAVPSVCPSRYPSVAPTTRSPTSIFPSMEPTTFSPSVSPTTIGPSVKPTRFPTVHPSVVPTAGPTQPTVVPTRAPSKPTVRPSVTPSFMPTVVPSLRPSALPTIKPSAAPTVAPTDLPTCTPTLQPSMEPSTAAPSVLPTTTEPSREPTSVAPTQPTVRPTTRCPTVRPTTIRPSAIPTVTPSVVPTVTPTTTKPTSAPTTTGPTVPPTTRSPTQPTVRPTSSVPTVTPSRCPTISPSTLPTTISPSAVPSTTKPTANPSTPQPTSPTLAPTFSLPSVAPSLLPSLLPSLMPTRAPSTSVPTTIRPSKKPSNSPTTIKPSIVPTVVPSVEPSVLPTTQSPSVRPSELPTVGPSFSPSVSPSTLSPSEEPTTSLPTTLLPTLCPTEKPTVLPSLLPTVKPSLLPTLSPSLRPSVAPTTDPSESPSEEPTTCLPTVKPTTSIPSRSPTTSRPTTTLPTHAPSKPTVRPSFCPTLVPTKFPSAIPSVVPSKAPSVDPSTKPTLEPTSIAPTIEPSIEPSSVSPSTTSPSVKPTRFPTIHPTLLPSKAPSVIPTVAPSKTPTVNPSMKPTVKPTSIAPSTIAPSSVSPTTASPSVKPSKCPSAHPSVIPSRKPTQPTVQPSARPSVTPTTAPSSNPSVAPTTKPSVVPSVAPSVCPSNSPTVAPSVSPSTLSPTLLPTTTKPTTSSPSVAPSIDPSITPTVNPSTGTPSISPSVVPTSSSPSVTPSTTGPTTTAPTHSPSQPTVVPTTAKPSTAGPTQPTVTPTDSPTKPTVRPSFSPTFVPTKLPSAVPSVCPSRYPSVAPTTRSPTSISPSMEPTTFSPSVSPTTIGPSVKPTRFPSARPSLQPSSVVPSHLPTQMPSKPTVRPSRIPSFAPTTRLPTVLPTTIRPSAVPSIKPSCLPSVSPSLHPTEEPSIAPSLFPTEEPSLTPTVEPSSATPSEEPSLCPSAEPTTAKPSVEPTVMPSESPSLAPSSSQPTTSSPSHLPSQPTQTPTTRSPSVGPTTVSPTVGPTPLPGDPTCLPTVKPSNSPTFLPSFQDAPIVSFTISTTLTGLTSATLDSSDQKAIISAMSSSLGISSSYVSFGSSVTNRRRLLRMMDATFSVTVTADVVIPLIDMGTTDASAVYSDLTSAFDSAITNGDFNSYLTAASTTFGSSSTGSATVSTYSVTSLDVQNPPSFLPTTQLPTIKPTTRMPSVRPSKFPSRSPTVKPTVSPTTRSPTQPTVVPTSSQPTVHPTTLLPTIGPSVLPTTIAPSSFKPTFMPTRKPTSAKPSVVPSFFPSVVPTTALPTVTPTTSAPTVSPTTKAPTIVPSAVPSVSPTTVAPSVVPTTSSPTVKPTANPTTPTVVPSFKPTSPTVVPTSAVPTVTPSRAPSVVPSTKPTATPTFRPSALPSIHPSARPTTIKPSRKPTFFPTFMPTAVPSSSKPSRPQLADDPVLTAFDLDCNIGLLTLYFSELVTAGTMTVSKIALLAPYNNTEGASNPSPIYLTKAFNSLVDQGNTSTVIIYMVAEDFARVRSDPLVASSAESTYLMIEKGAVFNPFNQANRAKNETQSLLVQSYASDSTPPYLVSFTLDMDNGIMGITFSEPMNFDTFTLNGLALQARKYTKTMTDVYIEIDKFSSRYYQLVHNSEVKLLETSNYNRTVRFTLGISNMNDIKVINNLAVSTETTYLSAWRPFITDVNNNNISMVGIDKLNGLRASIYYPDITPPTVLSWNFDHNTGRARVQFSETVNIVFMNYSSFVFTNVANVTLATLNNVSISSLRVNLPTNTSNQNADNVIFYLNSQQLDELKNLPHLLKRKSESFLLVDFNAVVDMSLTQNVYPATVSATRTNALKIADLIVDAIPPVLYSFTVNMEKHLITLLFTEVVDVNSIQIPMMTLQSAVDITLSTEYFVFQKPNVTVLTTEDSTEIQLLLSTSAYSYLKSFSSLCTSVDTTYLAIKREFILDDATNPNKVLEIYQDNALKASTFSSDTSRPFLLSWKIDLSADLIRLIFNKPIDSSSMDLSVLRISTDAEVIQSTRSVNLTDSYVLSTDIGMVVIKLSDADSKAIKSTPGLCVSLASCYVSFSSALCNDSATLDSETGLIAAFPVVEVEAVEVIQYSTDSVAPKLANFTLNLNDKTVLFEFDEPVDCQFMNYSLVTLTTSSDVSQGLANHTRLSSFDYTASRDAFSFAVHLTMVDFIRIQQTSPLGTSKLTTFLTIQSSSVSDVFGNALSSDYATDSINAAAFIADSTAPQMIGIYLDNAKKNLTVYFDEVIQRSSVNKAQLNLASTSGVKFSLGGSTMFPGPDSNSIKFSIAAIFSDLTATSLAQKQTNTYLYLAADNCVRDVSTAENGNVRMIYSDAIRDGYRVIGFRLDMSSQSSAKLTLELAFYDAENPIASIDVTGLTLISSDNSESYALTSYSAYIVIEGEYLLEISLSAQDYLLIMRKFPLKSASELILTAALTTITDVNSKVLSNKATVDCSYLLSDQTDLELSRYTINMVTGVMVLYFSKEVVLSSINLNDTLILQSTRIFDETSTVQLALTDLSVKTTTSIGSSLYADFIQVSLNNFNSANMNITTRELILQSYPLGYNTSFLAVKKGLIFDKAGNALNAIPASSALISDQVVVDDTPPQFESYDLDMNSRVLTLYFSEAVSPNNVHVDYFIFEQNPDNATSVNYTLTTSSRLLTSFDSHVVNILISQFDMNNMMRLAPNLLNFASNTFLSCLLGAFTDIAVPPNLLPVTLYRYGKPVTTFVDDVTPPVLQSYNISIQKGKLDFVFDEVVNCSSVKVQAIYFQSDRFIGTQKGKQFYLTSASVVDCSKLIYDTHVHIDIGYDDLVALKSLSGLMKNENNTFLRLAVGSFRDTAGNSIDPIPDGYALTALQFTPDTVRPHLLSFYVNDIFHLTITFNEPMMVSSLRVKEFMFQNSFYPYSRRYNLVKTKLLSVDDFNQRFVFLMDKDFDNIYGTSDIFQSQTTTFLSATFNAAKDASGNKLFNVTEYHPLQMGPSVVYWDVNLNSGKLSLFYDEKVDSSFTLGNNFAIQSNYDYQLPTFAPTPTPTDSPSVVPTVHPSVVPTRSPSVTPTAIPSIQPSAHPSTKPSITPSALPSLHPSTLPSDSPALISSRPSQEPTISPTMEPSTAPSVHPSLAPSVSPSVKPTMEPTIQPSASPTTEPSIKPSQSPSTAPSEIPSVHPSRFPTLPPYAQNETLDLVTTAPFSVVSHASNAIEGITEYYTYLSALDLNNFKLSLLINLKELIYLISPFGVTQSMNANDVIPFLKSVALRDYMALPVRKFVPDTTAPLCLNYSLNINAGNLVFEFNEPIDPDSVSLEDVVLISSSQGTFTILTSDDRNVFLTNHTRINVKLNMKDLNNIKLAVHDGGVLDFLVLNRHAVADYSGNYFVGNDADSPIFLTEFTDDVSYPVLTNATLDLNTYILYLVFDEFIDIASIAATNVVMGNSHSLPLTLTNYTAVTQDPTALNVVELDLSFFQSDVYKLQSLYDIPIGVNSSNSYVGITGYADIFGNRKSVMETMQVSYVVPDSSLLTLLAFDSVEDTVNSEYQFTLYFDQYVPVSALDFTDFYFRDGLTSSSNVVNLQASDATVTNTATVNRTIVITVPASLFTGTSIGVSQSSTFLAVYSSPFIVNVAYRNGFTVDLYGNRLNNIPPFAPLQVGPQLVDCSLNMNYGQLLLVFNKPIVLTSFNNISSIGFYSAVSKSFYFLSNSTAENTLLLSYNVDKVEEDNVVKLLLNSFDLSAIKELKVAKDELYLLMKEDFVKDSSSIPAVTRSLSRDNKLLISRLVLDNQAPNLLYITLDLSSEILFLYFDEPILGSSVVTTNIRIQSRVNTDLTDDSQFIQLSGGDVFTNGNTLRIHLLEVDAAVIKLSSQFGKNVTNTFVSFNYKTFTDWAGNFGTSIDNLAAQPANEVVADTESPVLKSFDLDLSGENSSAVLTLNFNEPVTVANFVITDITIQSRYFSKTGSYHQLTGGTLLDSDGAVIRIQLLDSDILAMMLTPGLIRTRQSTYLVIPSTLTSDLSGNAVIAYIDGKALACSIYIRDDRPPHILSTTLHMNEGWVEFEMSEPIMLTTVDVTSLTMQLQTYNSSTSYTFTKLSVVNTTLPLSLTVLVMLSASDLDSLTSRYPLVSVISTSWLSFSQTLMTDGSQNYIVPISASNPLQATVYLNDTIRPTVESFVLDMDDQLLTLTFSEAVRLSSIRVDQLFLQSTPTARFGKRIQLNESTFALGVDEFSTTLRIFLSPAAFQFLQFYGIGYDLLSSYLVWTDIFVSDNKGNYLLPYWDASVFGYSPRVPDQLLVDSIQPVLNKWYIDRSTASSLKLYLRFSEPVLLRNQTTFTIHTSSSQSSEAMSFSVLYSDLATSSLENTQIVIALHNYCKLGSVILETIAGCSGTTLYEALLAGTTDSSTPLYLTLSHGSVVDMAKIANPIEAIVTHKPLIETGPDCSACPSGQFTHQNCSSSVDRVCKPCTACVNGQYTQTQCSAYHDTSCAVCSECAYGKYIAAPCLASGFSDIQCAPCSKCNNLQYISQKCEYGVDVICDSCEVCQFTSDVMRKQCENGLWASWAKENCCSDSKGNKINCGEVAAVMTMEAAVSGHHDIAESLFSHEVKKTNTASSYKLGRSS